MKECNYCANSSCNVIRSAWPKMRSKGIRGMTPEMHRTPCKLYIPLQNFTQRLIEVAAYHEVVERGSVTNIANTIKVLEEQFPGGNFGRWLR